MQKRFSPKRQAILDCLRATDRHPTAEWVFAQVKPHCPAISLATVYRNLSELVAEGVIRSVGVYQGREHFDGCATPHVHLICDRCGRIADAHELPLPTAWCTSVLTATGFAASDAYLHGCCRACADTSPTKQT